MYPTGADCGRNCSLYLGIQCGKSHVVIRATTTRNRTMDCFRFIARPCLIAVFVLLVWEWYISSALNKIPYQIVHVEWEDSCRPVSQWQWIDDYEVPEIVRCVSVGYLIARTKKALAIAPNLGDVEQEKCQASGIIRIPKSAVKKVTYLSCA